MKIRIVIYSTSTEQSTHLRRKVKRLFDRLGLGQLNFIRSDEEWQDLYYEGDAPTEKQVDEIFRNL